MPGSLPPRPYAPGQAEHERCEGESEENTPLRGVSVERAEPARPSSDSRHLTENLHIRRNTAILASVMAVYVGVLSLAAAVLSLTFVLVTGYRSLLGLGPGDLPRRRPRFPPCRPGVRWTASGGCR